MKATLIAIAAVSIATAIFAISEAISLKKDVTRLTDNIVAIKQQPVVSDSGRIIDVQHVNLTLAEIKKALPELKAELKAQGIKLNNLVTYQTAAMEVNAKFQASVTDSLIAQKNYIIQTYEDKWLKYESIQAQGDTIANVKANIPIKIDNSAYLFRDGFPFGWGWFKPYKLRQKMHTDNPYVKLKYQEVIDVKRD